MIVSAIVGIHREAAEISSVDQTVDWIDLRQHDLNLCCGSRTVEDVDPGLQCYQRRTGCLVIVIVASFEWHPDGKAAAAIDVLD